MNDGLLAHHAALLTASAISDEVASARGYRSVERKARLTELGFSVRQARVPALLIPVWSVAGNVLLTTDRLIRTTVLLRRCAMRLRPISDVGKDSSASRVASMVPEATTTAQLGAMSRNVG